MIKLKNRVIDDYGRVVMPYNELFSYIYDGNPTELIYSEDCEEIQHYNKLWRDRDEPNKQIRIPENLDIDLNEYHLLRQQNWIIPQKYVEMNVREFLLDKCNSQEQINRVDLELKLFEERDMISVVKFLIYLVDVMRSNNIVWGVGRGSSTASYCLYLIGIHKIDSIKYDLDVTEFLR